MRNLVLVASLSSLYDDLCVIDHVHARGKQPKHQISEVDDAVAEEPCEEAVEDHALNQGRYDASEEKVRAALAEECD